MGLLSQFSSKAEMHRRETIKRFDEFLESYIGKMETVEKPALDELSITLVSRGPESAVAAALLRRADKLIEIGCEIRAIFVNIDSACEFSDFIEMTGMCNGQHCLSDSIRWAKNPSLLDAHEQLVLGASHCWSGDAMRRSSDTRFALDLFECADCTTIDLGRMAFDGLWSASAAVPKSRFRNVVAPSRSPAPVVAQMEGVREGLQDISFSAAVVTRH